MSTVSSPLGPIAGRERVAQRAAEAMLRSLGATRVTLRVAQPPIDSVSSQLGMACSGFDDVSLYPVVVRSTSMFANETVKVEALVDRFLYNVSIAKRRKECPACTSSGRLRASH
jgi:hypothetical protein